MNLTLSPFNELSTDQNLSGILTVCGADGAADAGWGDLRINSNVGTNFGNVATADGTTPQNLKVTVELSDADADFGLLCNFREIETI